jgi:hypothetical protein
MPIIGKFLGDAWPIGQNAVNSQSLIELIGTRKNSDSWFSAA